MNWYDYNPEAPSGVSGTLTAGALDSWLFYSKPTGLLSGIALDIDIPKKSNVTFSAKFGGYAGCPLNYGIYIVKNKGIIKKYNYTFDDQGTLTTRVIDIVLEPGKYTIVLGSDTTYEFGAYSDTLLIDEIVPVIKNPPTHKKSLWCWEESCIREPQKVIDICKKLSVDAIYQEAVTTSLYDDPVFFNYIDTLKENGIDFYFIFGQAEWYKDIVTLKEKIDIVSNYNKKHPEHQANGVIFDVEPHVCEDGVDIIQKQITWRKNAKETYIYANSLGVRVIYCNPVFFVPDTVRSFIRYSDGISYMNYQKNQILTGIDDEINIAKESGDWVENISEFQAPPRVAEGDTFNAEGIEGAHKVWKQLQDKYQYDKLAFSYHYYLPLVDLIKQYNITFNFSPCFAVNSKQLKMIPIKAGQLIVTTNDQGLYVDINDFQRIWLNNYEKMGKDIVTKDYIDDIIGGIENGTY